MDTLFKRALFLLSILVTAQVNAQQLIPFQARLTDGTGAVVADGVYAINFNIYDAATGGTSLWTETHGSVSIIGGVVNVILGSITSLNDPNNDGDTADAVTFYQTDGDRFIGIAIGAGQEMVPRHQLVPSFHSVTANNAANLGGNAPSYYAANSDLQLITNKVNNMSGLIGAFAGNCPTGWLLADGTSGTPDLRGRFIRGEPSGDSTSLDVAGNDDAQVVAHNHLVDPPNNQTTSAGNHRHIQGAAIRQYGGTFDYSWVAGSSRTEGTSGPGSYNTHPYTSSTGAHTHNVNIGPFNSASTGVSGIGANMPRYYEVIYCVMQ